MLEHGLTPTRTVLFFVLAMLLTAVVHLRTVDIRNLGDNLPYYQDTRNMTSLSGLIAGSYSYARTRHTDKGDTLIFRPGVFAVLSLCKHYFGEEDQRSWQIATLAMHMVACLALYLLLLRILPGSLPVLGLFWYANLAPANVMVIYSHVGPYSLALALVLWCLGLVHSRVELGRGGAGGLWLAAFLLLAATFFLEVYSLLGVALCGCLAWKGREPGSGWRGLLAAPLRTPSCLIFLLPPLIFAAANIADYLHHLEFIRASLTRAKDSLDGPGQVFYWKMIPDTIYHVFRLLDVWGWRGIAPYSNGLLFNLVLLGLAGWGIHRQRRAGRSLKEALGRAWRAVLSFLDQNPFVAALFFTGLGIAAVYILTRMNLRGTTYAREAPFYAFPLWAFLLVSCATVLRKSAGFRWTAIRARHYWAFAVLVLAPNAVMSFLQTVEYAHRFPAAAPLFGF